MGLDQFRQPIAYRDEAGRHWAVRRIVNHPEVEGLKLATSVCVDDCDTGIPERSIDRKDAHHLAKS
jgi:hypothetical protein